VFSPAIEGNDHAQAVRRDPEVSRVSPTIHPAVRTFWRTQRGRADGSDTDVSFWRDPSRRRARDADGSRLETARETALAITSGKAGGRYAVVAFKGDAVLAVPMTEDVRAVEDFLSAAGPWAVNAPGSNPGAALETALKAFSPGAQYRRAIALITDGESATDASVKTAEKAGAALTPVFVAGTGGVKPVFIPLPDGGFLKDAAGGTVLTRLNEDTLKRLASASGGEYFSCGEPGAKAGLVSKLADYGEARNSAGLRLVPNSLSSDFLFWAFVSLVCLICVSSFFGVKKRVKA
jgi:hypothetical protein